MKLSFDTIKSITVGALTITEHDDGIRFAKCTTKQLDGWLAFSETLFNNAAAATGIRLDFHTNSKNFKFTAPVGNKFEIYVNDSFCYFFPESALVDRSASIELDGNDNRITLYLPCHAPAVVISAIEVDDGATVTPHKFDTKLLFIGDSITQGWDSTYDSLSYAHRVSRFFNADSVIQGIGGGFFHETIFDEDMPYDPDVIITAFGTNDWGRFSTLEEILDNMNKFLASINRRYPDKTLICLSPIWRDVSANPIRQSGSFDALCEALKDTAKKNGAIVIDGFTLTPHHPNFFMDKTLHPNAIGFGIYAENLIKAIKDYI